LSLTTRSDLRETGGMPQNSLPSSSSPVRSVWGRSPQLPPAGFPALCHRCSGSAARHYPT